MAREEASSLLTESRLADQHAAVSTKAGMTATKMAGFPASAQLQTLSPPSDHGKGSLRPPTLRTRSTGGLMLTRENEFYAVESPSPVLSPQHFGLDGLSESLAHLMKQRRHSHTGEEERSKEKGFARAFTKAFTSDHRETSEGLLAAGTHASAPHDADTAPTSSASSSRPISPSPHHISTPHSGPSTTRTSLYSSQKLSPPQMSDYVSKQSSKATSSTTAASVTATRNNSQHQSTPWPTALGMLRKASADEQQSFSAESSRAQSPFDSGSTTPRTWLQVAGGGKSKPQVLETHRLQLQTHAATGRRMINQYIIETELGRGVHGKVRLARDTETGERVAVKIVEREGKKRLGGGLGWNAKVARDDSDSMRNSKEAIDGAKADATIREGGASTNDRPTSPKARFADESTKATQTSSSSDPSKQITAGSSLAARMWGAGKAAHSSSADNEAEERAQKEKRQEARKRQLWTTDKKVKREIALLKKCAHENVVQLKEVIDDPSSKKIFMVLEFMEGGEVQWKDERGFPTLTVDEARRTLRDVVLGLEYLHYQGIIHRDIKPANLLWDANHKVKISDFGVSHFSYALLVASGGLPSLDGDEERMKDPSLVDDHELAKTAGSPAFFAPELCLAGEPMQTGNSQASARTRATARHEDPNEFPWLKKDASSSREASADGTKALKRNRPPITKAIDVWALGVTLYCLLFGHVPFTADSEFALFTIIPREDYALPAFMGADRIRIGPRKKRWTTLPQWQDEEADVDQESQDGKESDADPSLLSEEARLVRDLLDQLLEKDPSKRIKLEDAKKHPWLMRDIANPPQWLCETDPAQLPSVEVSNEEVDGALTGFSKIKQTLKRFQTKLFAGLAGQGQHLPSSDDRADYGQQHRKSHIVSGVTIRRQRSKSTSHAQGEAPILQSTGHSKAGGHARLQAFAPLPSTTMSSAAPKSQASSNRPHLFFKRRPSVPSVGTVSIAGVVEGVTRVTSRSQPGSRPQSPAVTELSAEKGVRSKGSDKEIPPLERGRKTPNRQSSFFKRTASRVEPRESTSSLQNAYSSDRFSSSKGLPNKASDVSSLPLSRTGSDKTARDRNATHPSSAGDLTLPRSSLDSEAGQWSLVSASQSGSVAHTPLSTQRPQVGRPRSRSRLSDVFRNVLGHQAHTDARSGGAGSKSRNYQDGTVEASTPATVSQTSAAREPRGEDEEEEKEEEEQSRLEGVMTAAAATEPVARSIDVDDYDVDLDLSDDDLDDDRVRSHNHFLRNDGRGWRMERNATSSSASHAEQHRPNSATSDSLTPSVEGGYNLFKAPYLGFVQDAAKVTDDTESYAMTGFHSDEAEALRRASAKVGDDCGHRHGEVAWAADTEAMGDIVDPLTMGNVSAMTEDRFADADEEDSGVVSHIDEDIAADEEDDEDDGGVSFQARKRGNS